LWLYTACKVLGLQQWHSEGGAVDVDRTGRNFLGGGKKHAVIIYNNDAINHIYYRHE